MRRDDYELEPIFRNDELYNERGGNIYGDIYVEPGWDPMPEHYTKPQLIDTPPIYEPPVYTPPNYYDEPWRQPEYEQVLPANPPVENSVEVMQTTAAPANSKYDRRFRRQPPQMETQPPTKIIITKLPPVAEPVLYPNGKPMPKNPGLPPVAQDAQEADELLFGYPKNTVLIVGGIAAGGLALWMFSGK